MNSHHQKKILQASLLVALSGILYGFLGYLGTKIIHENLSISTMLFWRFLVAGLWMLLFVMKNHLKTNSVNFNAKILFFTFLLGAIGYSGSSGFYFLACRYTGTGLAMVIFFSYPIIVSLYTWIAHREGLSIATISVLIAMTIGLFLLQSPSPGTWQPAINFIGILFGLLASVSYAIYVIGSKKFSSRLIDSNLLTMVVCFSCALLFLMISIATKSFAIPSIKSWGYILALGVLVTALPIQLMLEGLKHISSMRASIISVLEPLVTVLVGVGLLNESISKVQMLGAVLILSSAILVQFHKKL